MLGSALHVRLWPSFLFASPPSGRFLLCSGGCTMNIYFLGYYSVLLILMMASVYKAEQKARQRFALAHRLRHLASRIATMDLEAAEDMLVSEGTDHLDDAEENGRLLGIVRNLKLYRPFLPESLFQANDSDEEDDLFILEHDGPRETPEHPNSPTSPTHAQHAAVGAKLGVSLKTCIGTVLMVQTDIQDLDADDVEEIDEKFLGVVISSSEETEGTLLHFGLGQACVTWNTHHSHPQHQFTACNCAVTIQKKFYKAFPRRFRLHMGLASGVMVAGITGTDKRKSSVALGACTRHARRLLHLNPVLGTSILLASSVYEAVQGSVTSHIVDWVRMEMEDQHTAVYELTSIRASGDLPGEHVYTQAVTELRNYRPVKAQAYLEKYLLNVSHQNSPQAIRQALRLWRLAEYFQQSGGDTDTYFRTDGWDNVEARIDNEIQVPRHLQGTAALFLQGEDSMYDSDEEDTGGVAREAVAVDELQKELTKFRADASTETSEKIVNFIDKSGQSWSLSKNELGRGGFGVVYLGMSPNGVAARVFCLPSLPFCKHSMPAPVREVHEGVCRICMDQRLPCLSPAYFIGICT